MALPHHDERERGEVRRASQLGQMVIGACSKFGPEGEVTKHLLAQRVKHAHRGWVLDDEVVALSRRTLMPGGSHPYQNNVSTRSTMGSLSY